MSAAKVSAATRDAKRQDRALRSIRACELVATLAALRAALNFRQEELVQRNARHRKPHKGRTGRPVRTLTRDERLALALLLDKKPSKSLRAIAAATGIPRTTLARIISREPLRTTPIEVLRGPGGAWQRRKRRRQIKRELGINLDEVERQAKRVAREGRTLDASLKADGIDLAAIMTSDDGPEVLLPIAHANAP